MAIIWNRTCFPEIWWLVKHILQDGCNGEAFYTDFSTEPAKYVKVEDVGLKKWALFLGEKCIGQPRCLVKLERIGLWGVHIYQLDYKSQVFS